tara:strand:- start:397 stop:555 length:159 start_codon:yes stop_codon:yes gene_type:complete
MSTKRQRTIDEEEAPLRLSFQETKDSEEVTRALERIEELKLWVETRRERSKE